MEMGVLPLAPLKLGTNAQEDPSPPKMYASPSSPLELLLSVKLSHPSLTIPALPLQLSHLIIFELPQGPAIQLTHVQPTRVRAQLVISRGSSVSLAHSVLGQLGLEFRPTRCPPTATTQPQGPHKTTLILPPTSTPDLGIQ